MGTCTWQNHLLIPWFDLDESPLNQGLKLMIIRVTPQMYIFVYKSRTIFLKDYLKILNATDHSFCCLMQKKREWIHKCKKQLYYKSSLYCIVTDSEYNLQCSEALDPIVSDHEVCYINKRRESWSHQPSNDHKKRATTETQWTLNSWEYKFTLKDQAEKLWPLYEDQ